MTSTEPPLQHGSHEHDRTRHHLRHDPARRRAGARASRWTCRPSWRWRGRSTRSGVDIIEAGFPIASPADSEAVRQIAAERAAAGHRGAGADARPGHRRGGARARARPSGRASTRSSRPRICTCRRKLRITREECLDSAVSAVKLARALHRRCGVLGGGCDAQRPRLPVPRHRSGDRRRLHDGQPARHGRLRDAGRAPRVLRRDHRRASRTPTARSSARTATTISGSPSPTASRRSRAACGRSSARSTASASAPATRRSRSS